MAKRKAARKSATRKSAPKPKRKRTAKKRARKKPAPKLQPAIVDGLVLMLVSGATTDTATDYAIEKAELPRAAAVAHVDEARHRINLAAHFNREAELGTAYTRLNLLFQQSNRQRDYTAALAVQRELNKLLSLHQPAPANDADAAEEHQNPEADAIRSHLEPLKLGPDGTPLVELARLAALAILEADS